MYQYTPAQWLLIFYIYCFFGWCMETALVSLQQRRFVNRGFIRGPLLPLYGTGAVLILWVALPLENQPIWLFLAGMLAATALEYVTGLGMELLFKVKYWDYATHKFQFQGRICLDSSLAWGALSLLLVWVIHPPIERLALSFPPVVALVVAAGLSVLFVADVAYAFRTALNLAHVLAELTRIRAEADELREQLAETMQEKREQFADAAEQFAETVQEKREQFADAAEQFAETVQEKREQFADAAEQLTETVQEKRERLQAALDERLSAYEETRAKKLGRTGRWLVRAHPSAISKKFADALSELKEKLDQK